MKRRLDESSSNEINKVVEYERKYFALIELASKDTQQSEQLNKLVLNAKVMLILLSMCYNDRAFFEKYISQVDINLDIGSVLKDQGARSEFRKLFPDKWQGLIGNISTFIDVATNINNLVLVKRLHELGAKLEGYVPSKGKFPIHSVCINGFYEIFNWLIQQGVAVDVASNSTENTPLLYLAIYYKGREGCNNYLSMVNKLKMLGANCFHVNKEGKSVLDYIFEKGDLRLISYFEKEIRSEILRGVSFIRKFLPSIDVVEFLVACGERVVFEIYKEAAIKAKNTSNSYFSKLIQMQRQQELEELVQLERGDSSVFEAHIRQMQVIRPDTAEKLLKPHFFFDQKVFDTVLKSCSFTKLCDFDFLPWTTYNVDCFFYRVRSLVRHGVKPLGLKDAINSDVEAREYLMMHAILTKVLIAKVDKKAIDLTPACEDATNFNANELKNPNLNIIPLEHNALPPNQILKRLRENIINFKEFKFIQFIHKQSEANKENALDIYCDFNRLMTIGLPLIRTCKIAILDLMNFKISLKDVTINLPTEIWYRILDFSIEVRNTQSINLFMRMQAENCKGFIRE